MGIPERKEREKEQRRELILDAAEKVFQGKGFQAVTVDEIAEAAELSKGTIYLYYKSKEDILLAIHLRGEEIMYGMFVKATSTGEPVMHLINNLGESYFEFFKRYPHYFRTSQFFNNPQFHKEASQEMLDQCHEHAKKVWALVSNLVERAVDENIFRPDVIPLQAAIILWSTGTLLMQQMDTQGEYWKNLLGIDLEQTMKTAYRYVVEGMIRKDLRDKADRLMAGKWLYRD
jgi:AcrR family transcriptional regulator